MRIAFGTDERTPVTDAIRRDLAERGHDVSWSARASRGRTSAGRSARRWRRDEAERGVVCCWTGTGVSMAANKVAGVRAALCTDAETAKGARRWNDANVLAMGLRLTSPELAREMLDAFLATEADPGERAEIAKLGEPLRSPRWLVTDLKLTEWTSCGGCAAKWGGAPLAGARARRWPRPRADGRRCSSGWRRSTTPPSTG